MNILKNMYDVVFGKPIEKETLDSWAEICDDITKACIIGLPGALFLDVGMLEKVLAVFMLLVAAYLFLAIARFARQMKATSAMMNQKGEQ